MLKSYFKYGQTNAHDTVKFLALFTMIIDHIGLYMVPGMAECRVVGRIAMPLFLFLVGYTHNSEKKTKFDILYYGLGLYFFAYRLELWKGAEPLAINTIFPFNILITIFITRYVLNLLEKCVHKSYNLIGLFILFIMLYLFTSPFFEYGTLAFLFAMAGKLIRTQQFNRLVNNSFLLATSIAYVSIQSLLFGFGIFQIALFTVLMIAILMIMCLHTFKEIHISNVYADCIVKFVSRYSLQVYVGHVMLFKLYNLIFIF